MSKRWDPVLNVESYNSSPKVSDPNKQQCFWDVYISGVIPTCVAALGGVEVGHLLLEFRAASVGIGHAHHHHSPTKAITEQKRYNFFINLAQKSPSKENNMTYLKFIPSDILPPTTANRMAPPPLLLPTCRSLEPIEAVNTNDSQLNGSAAAAAHLPQPVTGTNRSR